MSERETAELLHEAVESGLEGSTELLLQAGIPADVRSCSTQCETCAASQGK